MARIEIYRTWYEQEKHANGEMLKMLASVPADGREDPRYQRALVLAAHLSACRENWLDRMTGVGAGSADWWPKSADLSELPGRFAAMEARWTGYLAQLDDDGLDMDFEFSAAPEKGDTYRWNIEGQIMQLVGHAFYHRGQIALLVGQLGGEPVDTDYLYWAFGQQPDRWRKLP